ncbi:MAG: Omp28-related outer membrane protein [Bacteroidetes bacterium]|nr:Omp28-related outer membrane protein [Bacteroidota bacterium]
MKRIFYLFVFVTALAGCDKVTQPNPYANINVDCPLDTALTNIVTSQVSSDVKTVLLEDYTGHTCGNCPRAARRAEALEKTHGKKLVVIAPHVSNQFASPEPKNCFCAGDTLYKEEFRTTTGNEWDTYFGLSSAGLPRGMVNREQPYAKGDGNWSSLINTAIAQPQTVKLEVTCVYDTVSSYLKAKVKSTFLKAFSADVMMNAVLTQDSIVAFQKDYAVPSGAITKYHDDLRPNYRFDNILLGSVNGSWGQLVKSAPANKDTATITTPCYQIGAKTCFYSNNNQHGIKDVCIKKQYINLIVFVYDKDTKEVLQVEKLRINGVQTTH